MISSEDMNNKPVQSSRSFSTIDDGPLRIHVGNIPFGWSDKHLREQFDVNDFKEKFFSRLSWISFRLDLRFS